MGIEKKKKTLKGQKKQENPVMIYVENYRINNDTIGNKRRCQKYVMIWERNEILKIRHIKSQKEKRNNKTLSYDNEKEKNY